MGVGRGHVDDASRGVGHAGGDGGDGGAEAGAVTGLIKRAGDGKAGDDGGERVVFRVGAVERDDGLGVLVERDGLRGGDRRGVGLGLDDEGDGDGGARRKGIVGLKIEAGLMGRDGEIGGIQGDLHLGLGARGERE